MSLICCVCLLSADLTRGRQVADDLMRVEQQVALEPPNARDAACAPYSTPADKELFGDLLFFALCLLL